MRSDPATRVFGDIRINTVVSGLVFLGAVAYLLLVRRPREVLAPAEDAGSVTRSGSADTAAPDSASGNPHPDNSASANSPSSPSMSANDPAPVSSPAASDSASGEPAG
jgi:hypothetical protein